MKANPQLNTLVYIYGTYIYYSTKATSPLRPHAHPCGLATHTLGVEAINRYITTQVNGIHTIARRMDDESKNPHVSTYLAAW